MKKFAITVAVAAMAAVASAKDFYLSPAGDDSADGSKEAPVRTLGRAVSLAQSAATEDGDTVHVASGRYNVDSKIVISSGSTPLTIRAEAPGFAVFSGAVPVTGWTTDPKDKRFLSAPVPYPIDDAKREFRTLIVGTNACPLASFPGYGEPDLGFLHTTAKFKMIIKNGGLPSEPIPTHAELVTVPYDPKTFPKGFDIAKTDIASAWVLMYHMWYDSPCTIISNNFAKHVFYLDPEPIWAVGAYNDRFELMNTREGLRKPGMWMLEIPTRRIVYYPRKGETAQNLRAELSRLHTVLDVRGGADLTLSGLTFEGCSAPFSKQGFGGVSSPPAVNVRNAGNLRLEQVAIRNVSGVGMKVSGANGAVMTGCDIGFTGGAGMTFNGSDSTIEGNLLHDTGWSTHSADICSLGGDGLRVVGNRMWMAPYCGIILGGGHHLIASNDISRVMRVLQDGGALYGGYHHCVVRDNFHHDMMEKGFNGFGAYAYYADEGSHDVLFTGNRSENVERSINMHITRDICISNNVFSHPGDMRMGMSNSINGRFVDNKCYFIGKFSYGNPASFIEWRGNQLFRGAKAGRPLKTYAKAGDGDWSLSALPPADPFVATEMKRPPVFDGVKSREEWPEKEARLARDEFGCYLGGNPSYVNVGFDKEWIYVLVSAGYYGHETRTEGHRFGRSDFCRVELGKNAFMLTMYTDGTVVSSDASYKPEPEKDYVVSAQNTLVYYAARIPYSVIGRKGPNSRSLPFNATLYRAEYDEFRVFDAATLANPVPGLLFFGAEAAKDELAKLKKRKVK